MSSEEESVFSEEDSLDESERSAQKEIHRVDALKKEQEHYLYKLSCERPLKKPSVQRVQDDKLTQLFDEVEEEMDILIAKAKQYVQYLFQKQGADNSDLPNTYLKVQPNILRKGKLTDYQLQGLNWLISLQEAGMNGILADQMGLGKTIQTIALLAFMKQFRGISGPHLIVGPLSTVGNWVRELSEWLPKCRVVKMMATEDWRNEYGKKLNQNNFDVIVTSYESIINNGAMLRKYRYHCLVIDEAHRLKNEETIFVTHLKRQSSTFKLLLTGTPIQNNPHELWSLLNYLMPQLFQSSQVFDTWIDINKAISEREVVSEEYERRNINMVQKAKQIIAAFMLRRTKSEVALEIPPKKEIHLYVQMTPIQKQHYKIVILDKKVTGETSQKSLQNVLMQLRKICQHIYMFPELEDRNLPSLGEHLIENSGKVKVLDMFLKKLYSENHKVILFSQFTSLLNILEDYLNYRQYKYCRLDGSTPIEVRDENIANFQKQDSDLFIFLLSTRAGGLGITLTAADTVIIYDSDFNPQLDQQAMDRAHRIGQTKSVMVYRLICKSTVEEKIIERQQIKLRWEQMIIDKGERIARINNSKEDLKSLATFGASQILKDEPYTEEDIETLLKRGEELTAQLNAEIEKKFKIINEQAAKVDLGLKRIKFHDFFKDPQNEKDLQAIKQEVQQQPNKQLASSKKPYIPLFSTLCSEVTVDTFKFCSDPELLKELMERKANDDLYQEYKEKKIEVILDINLLPLTEMENKKLDTLQESGFQWSQRDFKDFIAACIKYGRNDIDNIANSVGRSPKEIGEYLKEFNKQYTQIEDHEKFMVRIEKIETKLKNQKQYNTLIQRFLKLYQNPLCEMSFNIIYNNTQYSLEGDQLLIYATHVEGFGKWDKIQQYILKHEMSFFDDFMRSMTTKGMKQRVVLLLKSIKKQVETNEKQIKQQQKEEEQKRKDAKEEQKQPEDKQQESKQKSSSRSISRSKSNKKKSQSKSQAKSIAKKQKSRKPKSEKPISQIKSQSLDKSLKKIGKQVLQK